VTRPSACWRPVRGRCTRRCCSRQLSADVTFFSHTTTPADEEAEQLAARGIRLVDGEVASLEIAEDRLVGLRLRDGAVVGREVLAVSPGVWVAGNVTDLVAEETRQAVAAYRDGSLAESGARP
jgi:hypothetical protein